MYNIKGYTRLRNVSDNHFFQTFNTVSGCQWHQGWLMTTRDAYEGWDCGVSVTWAFWFFWFSWFSLLFVSLVSRFSRDCRLPLPRARLPTATVDYSRIQAGRQTHSRRLANSRSNSAANCQLQNSTFHALRKSENLKISHFSLSVSRAQHSSRPTLQHASRYHSTLASTPASTNPQRATFLSSLSGTFKLLLNYQEKFLLTTFTPLLSLLLTVCLFYQST